MTGTRIKRVEDADLDDFAALVKDMDRHYGKHVDYSVADARARARTRLIDEATSFALIARLDSQPVGLMSWTTPWPTTDLDPCLFLKDVFVREAARGRGVGRALFRVLARIALDGGYSRIDWTTERDNVDARRFYAALGATEKTEKVMYRLSGEALEHIVKHDTVRYGSAG